MASSFTLLDDGRAHSLQASGGDGAIRLAAAPTLDALGWTQKPEGLCQGEVCIPIAGRPGLFEGDDIDLAELAELLGRPLAVDREQDVASLGSPSKEHGAALVAGEAPDFTLPDLSGKEHSLSSFRGKKVLLIAHASW